MLTPTGRDAVYRLVSDLCARVPSRSIASHVVFVCLNTTLSPPRQERSQKLHQDVHTYAGRVSPRVVVMIPVFRMALCSWINTSPCCLPLAVVLHRIIVPDCAMMVTLNSLLRVYGVSAALWSEYQSMQLTLSGSFTRDVKHFLLNQNIHCPCILALDRVSLNRL